MLAFVMNYNNAILLHKSKYKLQYMQFRLINIHLLYKYICYSAKIIRSEKCGKRRKSILNRNKNCFFVLST